MLDFVGSPDVRAEELAYLGRLRLTKETIADPVNGNRTIEYTYDAVGNRLSRIDSVEGTTTYVYDENDLLVREELTQDGGLVRVYEYRYDNNGNTIERIEKDGSNNVIGNATYSWDKENRLVGVTTSTGDVISYEYDTDNIRVSSTVNGVTTEFLVDKNRPYAEVLSEYVDDAVAVNYLHGLDLISQEREGSESFYLVDGLGSTRVLTDEGGEVTNAYSYDAFGNLVASSGSIENEFLFAKEQYDENLDQYYLRQRYYDAGIGRFTRRDTYEGENFEPITLHKYLYGNANPVSNIDPTGLYSVSEALAASTIADTLNQIQLDRGLYAARVLGGEKGEEVADGMGNLQLATTIPDFLSAVTGITGALAGLASKSSNLARRFLKTSLRFADEDLVYGPTAGGRLGDLRNVAGGKTLTDYGAPYHLNLSTWEEFTIHHMEKARERGSTIHFDLTNVHDFKGILTNPDSQYYDRTTAKELRYLRENWNKFKNNVIFYFDVELIEEGGKTIARGIPIRGNDINL